MKFMRSMARGESEATPARALVSVVTLVGAAAAILIAVVLVVYVLA